VTGRPLQVDSAPDGDARLTGTIQILGRTVSASTRAKLGAQDGALSVQPTQLDTATRLDRASELLLSQRFAFLVPGSRSRTSIPQSGVSASKQAAWM
jgi:hypothetical protein